MKLIHRIGARYIVLSIAAGFVLSLVRSCYFSRFSTEVLSQKAVISGTVLFAILLFFIFLSFVLFFRYFKEIGTAKEAISAIEGMKVILWYFILEAPFLIILPHIGINQFTVVRFFFYYHPILIGILLLYIGIRNLAQKGLMPVAFMMLGISVFFYVIVSGDITMLWSSILVR